MADLLRSSVVVDIWNKALRKIGQTERIANTDGPGLAARICREEFLDCLDEALELRPFPWAEAQALPATLARTAARVGFGFAYILPADFVAARGLIQGELRLSLEPEDTAIVYAVQANDAGDGWIFCTDADLTDFDAFVYTRRMEVVTAWPALFKTAVAWRLAAELASGLVKGLEGVKLHDNALAHFEAALAVAHASSRNNLQRLDRDLDPPSIRARQ